MPEVSRLPLTSTWNEIGEGGSQRPTVLRACGRVDVWTCGRGRVDVWVCDVAEPPPFQNLLVQQGRPTRRETESTHLGEDGFALVLLGHLLVDRGDLPARTATIRVVVDNHRQPGLGLVVLDELGEVRMGLPKITQHAAQTNCGQ